MSPGEPRGVCLQPRQLTAPPGLPAPGRSPAEGIGSCLPEPPRPRTRRSPNGEAARHVAGLSSSGGRSVSSTKAIVPGGTTQRPMGTRWHGQQPSVCMSGLGSVSTLTGPKAEGPAAGLHPPGGCGSWASGVLPRGDPRGPGPTCVPSLPCPVGGHLQWHPSHRTTRGTKVGT